MTATTTTLHTRDLKQRIGTEVLAEKDTLLGGQHAATLRDLLEQRGVLVFPKIGFTDDEQVAFTETLGVFAPERIGEKVYSVTLDSTVNSSAD
jgi:alpha-ketoglutarate-dependent taurine dioxygenase